MPTVPKDSRQRYLPCGQAIGTFGARYVTASREMFAFANAGKYPIASSEARHIATAKAVISRFACVQNISPLDLPYKFPRLRLYAKNTDRTKIVFLHSAGISFSVLRSASSKGEVFSCNRVQKAT